MVAEFALPFLHSFGQLFNAKSQNSYRICASGLVKKKSLAPRQSKVLLANCPDRRKHTLTHRLSVVAKMALSFFLFSLCDMNESIVWSNSSLGTQARSGLRLVDHEYAKKKKNNNNNYESHCCFSLSVFVVGFNFVV